jgi:hypothetical protein
MRARDVVSSDVVAPRGYSTGGSASMLTVERSTLVSRVAWGTLGDGATPTLGAASSEGMVGVTISRRLRITVCRATASCDVAGMVPLSARSTSHAAKKVYVVRGDGWRGAMAGVEAPSVGNTMSLRCGMHR